MEGGGVGPEVVGAWPAVLSPGSPSGTVSGAPSPGRTAWQPHPIRAGAENLPGVLLPTGPRSGYLSELNEMNREMLVVD